MHSVLYNTVLVPPLHGKTCQEIQIVIIWVIFNQRSNKIIAEETELTVLPLQGNYWDAQDCPCNYECIWGLGPLWAWFIMPGSSRNAEEMELGMTRLWWSSSWLILPLSLAVRRNSILVYLAAREAGCSSWAQSEWQSPHRVEILLNELREWGQRQHDDSGRKNFWNHGWHGKNLAALKHCCEGGIKVWV